MNGAKNEHAAMVVENRELQPRYHRLTLQAPRIAANAQPGQYVHVLPPTGSGFDPLLRRAFSILSAQDETIEILFRTEGKGTGAIAKVQRDDVLDILGPLGRPFEWKIQQQRGEGAILVAGGVGAPPLAFLAQRWQESASGEGGALSVILGAQSENELICADDFAASGVEISIATDDGSRGHRGLVTELLQQQLASVSDSKAPMTVYSCGPWPMLKAVAALSEQAGVECFVSLEENMPCGIGVCNGCVVPVRDGGDDYGRYRRICVDGPVMKGREVDWHQ